MFHIPTSRRKTKSSKIGSKMSQFIIRLNVPIALFSSIILITIFMSLQITKLVECSPPIDYFIHTSQPNQLATTGNNNNANNPNTLASSMLPSLESIYNDNNANDKQETNPLASRVLSLIQNISHTHDNDQIDMETTSYAWHLMEKQALIYMRSRISSVKPMILALLNESQVGEDCQSSIKSWLDNLKDLEQWATLMWNSWGEFPPAGLFEGSFTDLGSYRGCMSIKDNEIIGQSQYCTLDYQPLAPTRPRFHSIFKKVLDVDEQTGQMTNGDFVTSNNRISSSDSAHGFSSSRYRSLSGQKGSGSGSAEKNSTSMNKYNKRTIVTSGDESSLGKQAQRNSSISTLSAGVSKIQGSLIGFKYFLLSTN